MFDTVWTENNYFSATAKIENSGDTLPIDNQWSDEGAQGGFETGRNDQDDENIAKN